MNQPTVVYMTDFGHVEITPEGIATVDITKDTSDTRKLDTVVQLANAFPENLTMDISYWTQRISTCVTALFDREIETALTNKTFVLSCNVKGFSKFNIEMTVEAEGFGYARFLRMWDYKVADLKK